MHTEISANVISRAAEILEKTAKDIDATVTLCFDEHTSGINNPQLQNIDRQTQLIRGVADVLHQISDSREVEQDRSPSDYFNDVKLAELRRLFEGSLDLENSENEKVELF